MTDVLELIDSSTLLEHFDHEDAPCENIKPHERINNDMPPCSGPATHHASTSCIPGNEGLICQALTEWTRKRMENPKWRCPKCKRSIAECWTLRPV